MEIKQYFGCSIFQDLNDVQSWLSDTSRNIWGFRPGREGFYYLCSKNKDTDQLGGNQAADLRLGFSHMQNQIF